MWGIKNDNMNLLVFRKISASKILTGLVVVFFILVLWGVNNAEAALLNGYESLQTASTGNGTVRVEAGQDIRYMVEFQNTGQKAWTRSGSEFVSIYTYEPKYRTSIFEDESWYRSDQPARLEEERVEPGQKGHVYLTFEAPAKTGIYREVFRLAAEDTAWIPGGQFAVVIEVVDELEVTAPVVTPEPAADSQAEGLSALLLLRSEKKVVAQGGQAIAYKVGIKNTGTKIWGQRQIRLPDLALASLETDTYHSSWTSTTQLAVNDNGTVAPGALDFIDFTFAAPRTQGSHTVRYQLAIDNVAVPDFYIDIPVEVTSNAPRVINSPNRAGTEPNEQATYKYDSPPMLRVGVLIVDEEIDWQVNISCATDWELRDIQGALLGELDSNQAVNAFYKNGRYHFNRGNGLEQSTYALRFVPKVSNTVCTVENFDRRVTRDYTHADNTFRNVLELHYNDYKDRTWLINELPMDYYLKGLGETSNISHMEYQKALVTAARTYATYHWQRNTKRAKEFFHVTAYADDQVYRGYGQEARSPRIAQSVDDSRGQIVTYDGELALTPYFSRTDGRTRDWSEVWYGQVDWLKSVACPCDKSKGYALWGHGVGMSATEALCMANNGDLYEDILKYFYQNIELEKYWK